jgi:hypothetical protein
VRVAPTRLAPRRFVNAGAYCTVGAVVAEQAGPPVKEIRVDVSGAADAADRGGTVAETVVATVVDPRPRDSTGSRPAMTRRAGRRR